MRNERELDPCVLPTAGASTGWRLHAKPELDLEPLAVHQSRWATHVRYGVTR